MPVAAHGEAKMYKNWSIQDLQNARHELQRDLAGSTPNWRIVIEQQITDIDRELNSRRISFKSAGATRRR